MDTQPQKPSQVPSQAPAAPEEGIAATGGQNASGSGSGPQSQPAVASSFGKLFVGQVPAVCTEEMLTPLFAPYGNLVEIKVMRDSAGRSKGCAWVRYETQAMAQAAIDSLHEKHTIPPQTNTLQVRYANATRDRADRRVSGERSGTESSSGGSPNPFYPIAAGAAAVTGGFGGMPGMQPPSMQRNPWGVVVPDHSHHHGGQQQVVYLSQQQQQQQQQQHNHHHHSSHQSQNPHSNPQLSQHQQQQSAGAYHVDWAHMYNGSGGGMGNNSAAGGGPGGAGAQRMPKSPPGMSVFVGNLPPTTTVAELRNAFQAQIGQRANVVQVNIHKDKRFGFVTFDTPQGAADAAVALNGMTMYDRKLRVEVTQNEPRGRGLMGNAGPGLGGMGVPISMPQPAAPTFPMMPTLRSFGMPQMAQLR